MQQNASMPVTHVLHNVIIKCKNYYVTHYSRPTLYTTHICTLTRTHMYTHNTCTFLFKMLLNSYANPKSCSVGWYTSMDNPSSLAPKPSKPLGILHCSILLGAWFSFSTQWLVALMN